METPQGVGCGRRGRATLWIIATVAFLVSVCPASGLAQELVKAEVIGVCDGDTLDVYILTPEEDLQADLRTTTALEGYPFARVRLAGINAPEVDHPEKPCECYGDEAWSALREMLPEGSVVWLELDRQASDQYKRLLAYAYLDPDASRMVNADLVLSGFATSMPVIPNLAHESLLARAEAQARQARVGLWSSCLFSWDEASERIGETAVFRGRVESTFFDSGASCVTFLNLGLAYPEPGRLTVVIRQQVRDLFISQLGGLPEDRLMGVEVAVFGKVVPRNDSFEIVLWRVDDIWSLSMPDVNEGRWSYGPDAADPKQDVVIVEVEANPPGQDLLNEWVLLTNTTDEDLCVGGWLVLARRGNPGAVMIDEGTVIPAHGSLRIGNTPFLWLDNENEYIELRDNTGRLIDATPFGDLNDDRNDDFTWRRDEEGE